MTAWARDHRAPHPQPYGPSRPAGGSRMLGRASVGGRPLRLEERKVAVTDLEVGMYVCRLDRDWVGTSFPLQGLQIRSRADVDMLARYSRFVFVDIDRGLSPDTWRPPGVDRSAAAWRPPAEPAADAAGPRRRTRGYSAEALLQMQGRHRHADSLAFNEELPNAREARGAVAGFAARMLDDVREGRPIAYGEVRRAVEPMVRSILRNADAFLWVDRLRQRGAYEYNHALACSALCAAFGRHIGFPEEMLVDMAIGGLLLNVGKLRVRDELLERPGPLSPEEMVEMRDHVAHSLDIVDEGRVVPGHVREMIRGHHEREDGSGYPDGLRGGDIQLLAKIAGLVDAFEAMTSERCYRHPLSRHEALQTLYRERGRGFAPELVEQFMQCLGVYPTGSLVALSTGEVAVVMGQNMARRLKPKVMVLTDTGKQTLAQFHPVDLMSYEAGGEPVVIVETLPPGTYGLDPQELFL